MSGSWVGLDAGHDDLDDAERAGSALADALGCVDEVCTHVVRGPRPHYAASLRIPDGRWAPEGAGELRAMAEGALVFESRDWAIEVGEAQARAGARSAVAAHAAGAAGRAIRFLGQAEMRGAVTVDQVLAASAIDRVQVLGAALVPGAVVETRDHLRPQYSAGSLTLVVTPLDGGRLQPFELEHAHQCCGGH